MTQAYAPRTVVMAAMLIVLALVPLYSAWIGSNFALILVTRIVILAIAAVSLNLIMGYGGMVSFGHAAYLGIGGYVVGILASDAVQPAQGRNLNGVAVAQGLRDDNRGSGFQRSDGALRDFYRFTVAAELTFLVLHRFLELRAGGRRATRRGGLLLLGVPRRLSAC